MFASNSVHANLSVKEWLNYSPDSQLTYGMGVLQGAVNTMNAITLVQNKLYPNEKNHNLFCLPARMSFNQLLSVAKVYMADHINQWNEDAAEIISLALFYKYPC